MRIYNKNFGSNLVLTSYLKDKTTTILHYCLIFNKFSTMPDKDQFRVKNNFYSGSLKKKQHLEPKGALTLKSFPFILRGWDIKNYDFIDPTDSFGQNTKVYVNKNQVIKIEPQFSNYSSYTWLTDKGRHFFDGIFSDIYESNIESSSSNIKSTKEWETLFKSITKTSYTLDICNFKSTTKKFFILVFENVSIETLNLLFLISQTHLFIKLRRVENIKINSDLESNFQIDSATSKSKLLSSSLCLLLSTNTRYEGSYLNLKLRQRYYKGNFKLLSIGSLTDFTFPVSFLGSNLSAFKTFLEGNQVFCKDLVNSKNPIFITNTELFKRANMQQFMGVIKVLKHINILNKIWNGYNVLNSSLHETGMYNLSSFSFLTLKDLTHFNSIYIVNTNINNIANFKKITESRLLNFRSSDEASKKSLFINQTFNAVLGNSSKYLKFKNYLYLPTGVLFENQETFINTEGFIKRTNKLISKKKTKNDWQLLRKFVKHLSVNTTFKNSRDQKTFLNKNTNNIFNFKNFINFQFYATQTLTNLSFYLGIKSQKFSMYKKFNSFKPISIKIFNTKLKYWLDDFYIGGKDKFCQNSLILIRCSTNYKLQTTNFF